MNKKNKGFTTIELITSFTLASVIMIILFNIILILKDNLSEVNAKTNMLVEKDNLSYNINKRFKEKEISSITMCDEGDKCYEFTYSDDTSDKLVYSNTDKTITFNNYTFDIIDGITVEEPVITEHYDTMSSTKYNGYFIIHIPIKIDNKDYSIKVNKHFNTDSLVIDLRKSVFDKSGNRYVLVEYLESTGTQYIDTDIIPNKDTKFIIDVQYIRTKNDEDFGLNYAGNVRFHIGIYKGYFHFGVGNVWKNVMTYDTERHVFSLDGTGNVMIDNNNYTTGSQLSSNAVLSIYLFALHGMAGRQTYSKLYSSQIFDNDTLVRDYIPVIDSTSRPCLFDKVSRECYYNQGTGEFLWG